MVPSTITRYLHRFPLLRKVRGLVSTSAAPAAPPLQSPQPVATPAASASDTFCVHPWTDLRLVSEGRAQVCCRYDKGSMVSAHGVPLSLDSSSLDDIWNSDEMRGIRRAMVEGRKVPGCAECYQEEKGGGFSMRMRDNRQWEAGWLNEERVTIESLQSRAVAGDFRLATLPSNIEIDTGNLCNLTCRMCHDGASSKIGKDAVQTRWTADHRTGTSFHDPDVPAAPAPIRRWRFDREFVRNELIRPDHQVKRIYFIGGEPLLVREIGDALQGVIEAGAAGNIRLAVVTNGTVKDSWLRHAKHFKSVEIAVSMDGFGPYYEYIRFPGRWTDVIGHLAALKKLPNTSVGGAVTLQAYNVLNIDQLFRHLDSMGVGFFAYPIHFPRYLCASAMPPIVRRLGAERLRSYAERDCLPHFREMVLGLASQLEPTSDRLDTRLLRDFMLFTNDLDKSRGQSFKATHGELFDLIAESGFTWTDETLHAGGGAQPIQVMRRS